MKMNLKQFKKVQEDEHTAVMQHPDGHHIVIAKSILSPKMRKDLDGLPVHAATGIRIPDPNSTPMPTEEELATGSLESPIPANPPAPAPQQPDEPFGSFENNKWTGNLFSKHPGQPRQTEAEFNAAEKQKAEGTSKYSQPTPPMTAQPRASEIGQLPQENVQGMKQAMGQQIAAQYGIAAATRKQGISEAAQAGNTADQMARIDQNYQANVQKYQAYHDAVMADHDLGHINPTHYMDNMGTGKKVATAIGLILGGMGAGLQGTTSAAADFLTKQIDRDIAAQQANFNNKNTLLKANSEMMGDMKDATDMTKLNLLGITAQKIAQAGAIAKSEQAKFNAMNAVGALKQQMIPIIDAMARRNALAQTMGGMGGGNNIEQQLQYFRVMDPARAKEMEERYIPGVGLASVKVPEKARDELLGRDDLQKQAEKLRAFAQQHAGSLDPATIQYGRTLANQVQDAYRRANGQGVFKESEAHFVQGIVDQDPTKFFNAFRTDPKYKALLDANAATLNHLRKGYGLPTTPQITPARTMGAG